MLRMLKWTGALLGVFAGTCLATHRAKLRREGNGGGGGAASVGSDGAGGGPPGAQRSDVRHPDTRLDAGGQTA